MSDPAHDIIQAFRSLFKASNSTTYTNTVLSNLRTIFNSKAVGEVFIYLCLHGASTAWVLQCELNIPEATVYSALRRLRVIGVLVPTIKVSKVKSSRGGPRPTIWALKDATRNDVVEARRLHYNLLSP